LQLNNSPLDCARELSKPSKDLANLLVCYENNFLGFCGPRHKWGRFLAILAQVTWPWTQPLDQAAQISNQQLGPGPGKLSQNGQKPTPLMMLLTQKNKTKKLFHCRFKDLLHHLRV